VEIAGGDLPSHHRAETAQLPFLIPVFFSFVSISLNRRPATSGNISFHRVLKELEILSGVEVKTKMSCLYKESDLAGRQMLTPERLVIRESTSLDHMDVRSSCPKQ
jgi:hypothetical protein